MTRWMPPEPDLFKTPTLNEPSALPRRTKALELLKMLLREAISATELPIILRVNDANTLSSHAGSSSVGATFK